MRLRDNEVSKVNNSEIKRLEKTLSKIDKEEDSLLKEFDKDISSILGDITLPVIIEVNKLTSTVNGVKNLFVDKVKSTRSIETKTGRYKVPDNFLKLIHKSYLSSSLREKYEKALTMWFSKKTEELKSEIKNVDSYEEVERILPRAYALASLALTAFHTRPNMILRDVQKLTGIAISEGSIAELGTGEGKTLSAILPVYLQALRGKGAHVITANSYLARRDFEETLPIFEGLGLTSGYLPENEEELAQSEGRDPKGISPIDRAELYSRLNKLKQDSYKKDITYGSKATFAFDYLRDNGIRKKEEMVQRLGRPGFALIDEVDDALVDDAQIPYRIAQHTPTYEPGLTLKRLCTMFNTSVKEIESKVESVGISTGKLTYEEASYIAKDFLNGELLPDQSRYQEIAQLFFEHQKLLVTEDNMYGFKTGKDLYNAIMDEKNYNSDGIKNKYDIVYCREKKEYTINDRCYENFLKFCYLAIHMNSDILMYQKRIQSDSNYINGQDYILVNGKISITNQGAGKIIYDSNYPKIMENYQKYMSSVTQEAAVMVHYLQQAVIANLIMKNGQDYAIDDGKVKTMKNGRIQEGSTYSNGLHQAIEIKEGIKKENRTKETVSSSSITQKDFYQRYDMFSGMTGTSAKELFNDIYGKPTIEIPKHAFYSFFSRRKLKNAKEPIGIDKKDAVFAITLEEKINLMIKSVIESRKSNPPQPVLLVVSNVDEIGYLEAALKVNGIEFNTLTATTNKETEAEIVAIAGRPGAVTISTEMAGRGTDIKVGGDRETIIDIETRRHMRKIEAQFGHIEFTREELTQIRKKVETALLNSKTFNLWSKQEEQVSSHMLEKTGLKVISSGYFKMARVDRQLEGRTGRNGISGVCERFVYPDDLKRIGISSIDGKNSIVDFLKKYNKNSDGSLQVDRRGYDTITEKVRSIQQVHEDSIKRSIQDTQKLDNHATKLVEEYREQRRLIICDEVDVKQETLKLIENSIDAIIASYIQKENFNKKDLLTPIKDSKLGINIEAISLEVKKVLGVSFEPSNILKTNINLLELRNAVIESAKERLNAKDNEVIKQSLLIKYDYMIKNIPYLLDHSFTVKRLTAMSMGMENQADFNAEIEFYNHRQRINLDASKLSAKQLLGLPLTLDQDKKLEMIKEDMFEMKVIKNNEDSYEVKESKNEENNLSAFERMRAIKAKLVAKDESKLEKINSKIDKLESKGREVSLSNLYRGLNVRPMKFIKCMSEGREVSKLVLVRQWKSKTNEEEKKL